MIDCCTPCAEMSTGACCSARDELTCIRTARDAFRLHATPSLRATRRRREFTPDEQKDSNYWLKRSRNNEAAKRSRQRKRMEERLLETRAVQLQRENDTLKAALCAVQLHRSGPSSPPDPGLRFPVAPTAVLPCCGFPHANHVAFGLTAYSASKSPRIGFLDGYYPMGFAHGTSAFTRSRSGDSPEMLGLPDFRSAPGARSHPRAASSASPAVLLPHKLRYKAASFASSPQQNRP